ncbi:putative ribonuclease H-like domain-containing protein [Tanacetum coccineum]
MVSSSGIELVRASLKEDLFQPLRRGSSSETMDQTFDRLQKLITQLEIQGEVITQEDMNLKLTNSNSSTNEEDNTAYEVSATHTQSNPSIGDNLYDAVICAFLVSQPNSPQMSRDDLEQIDPDDLEEMDLQWEMAMLTIRARRLIKRTGRQLDVNGQRVGFDRSKLECYNCHKYGYFARKCKAPRNQDNREKDNSKRTVIVETPTKNSLVAQDRIGGYDWSYQAEEEHPTNFALIAHTSLGSSSSSDSEGNPQQKEYKEKGVIDSGCSRHMTGNKCYLTEYEDYDGGFVSFRDGKAIDERSSLAESSRKDNIYSVDLKSVVPTKGLTCLFAKATINESNLWHRAECVAERRNRTLIEAARTMSVKDRCWKRGLLNGRSGASNKDGRMIKPTRRGQITKIIKTAYLPIFSLKWNQERDSSSAISKLDRSNARGASTISTLEVRNKARLVAQGYTQEKGIDYDEFFAPVARIEAIRLFLAYASFMGFIVYQVDVKSAFLYSTIEEEVYVCQPLGFEDPRFPNKVYKVEKALYGLHQAHRAWYETLSTYLIENGFRRGTIDKTLFIKKDKGDILLGRVYVDDIIFGSTKKSSCDEFEGLMHKRF